MSASMHHAEHESPQRLTARASRLCTVPRNQLHVVALRASVMLCSAASGKRRIWNEMGPNQTDFWRREVCQVTCKRQAARV